MNGDEPLLCGWKCAAERTDIHVTRLVNWSSSKWNRSCTLAIVNRSGYTLTKPTVYLSSGEIEHLPPYIESGFTSIIAAHKTAHTAKGSVGVVTYELSGRAGDQLQVMWSVPYDGNLYDKWTNVAIGTDVASSSLFKTMYKGSSGLPCGPFKAKKTPVILEASLFKMRILMTDQWNSSLTVYFSEFDEQDNQELSQRYSEHNFVY